jgi:hypothetical protein
VVDAEPTVVPAAPAVVIEPTPAPAPPRVVDPDAHDERLQRIERSMLRIERIQMQTLAMLRELAEELRHDVDHGDGGTAE